MLKKNWTTEEMALKFGVSVVALRSWLRRPGIPRPLFRSKRRNYFTTAAVDLLRPYVALRLIGFTHEASVKLGPFVERYGLKPIEVLFQQHWNAT